MSGKSKYRKRKRHILLDFAPDHPLHGLEVQCRPVDLNEYLTIVDLADLKGASMRDQAHGLAELCRVFAGVIVGWNLTDEDDGTGEDIDVPATAEGMMSQEVDFVLALVSAWMDAVGGVPAPLPEGSNSGGPSPVGSIPMDVS